MLKNFVLMAGAVVVLSGCSACSNVEDEPIGASATNLPTVQDGDYADTMVVDTHKNMMAMGGYKMVNFGYDSSVLSSEAQKNLNMFADYAKKSGVKQVVIEGHCDERGTREYNLALGERRANSVKRYLVGLGLDSRSLSTVSFGKERPMDTSHTPAAWASNRRAMLVAK
ncbi:MAG: peptidoglycan-associated lipoprotein Pal [Alphaproteobacteria bacterium]|jgi:peptidoglycan-associated lipoprotein|nr:peptidoglycan-associated lipoprotein Pal [Alphaproteobacteria bacterium]